MNDQSLDNWLANKKGTTQEPTQDLNQDQNTGTFGDIVDLAQAGAIESASGVADFFGAEKTAESLTDWAGEQYETLTPEMRESMAKRFVNDDLTIGEGAKDWRSWLGQAAKLSGQMATTIVPGSAVGKAAQVAGAGVKAIKGASGGTIMLANVASAGGMQGQGIAEEINNMSFSDLQDSPQFKELAFKYSDAGDSATTAMTKARAELADSAQSQVMYDPTLAGLNAVAGYVGDTAMTKLIKGNLGKTIKGNIAKGLLVETPTEALQGGYGQYVVNIAANDAGLERDLMDGVYAAAAEEGLIAGGVGAGGGAIGGTTRAMINRLDRRVETQDKIEQVSADSIKNLSESGASEQEIRDIVGPKLEKAAMAKGHDAEEAADIAKQAIDMGLGKTKSVLERQADSLSKAEQLATKPATEQVTAEQVTTEQIAPTEEPAAAPTNVDPETGEIISLSTEEVQKAESDYQNILSQIGQLDYKKGNAIDEVRRRLKGEAQSVIDENVNLETERFDNEIFKLQDQARGIKDLIDQTTSPAIEPQAPVQEELLIQEEVTPQEPQVQEEAALPQEFVQEEVIQEQQTPDSSIYRLEEGYQPTEAAQRMRERMGVDLREDLMRQSGEHSTIEGLQPTAEDAPTQAAERVRQQLARQQAEDAIWKQREQEEAAQYISPEEAFSDVESEQAQAQADVERLTKPEDATKVQEQDVIAPQRERTQQIDPSTLTPQQQIDYYRDRGVTFGTLGKEPKLGERVATGDTPRLAKKKQKKLDKSLQTILDRIAQPDPESTPEIQQFGEAPNTAMAEAFARLNKTSKKPSKDEQIDRVLDLLDDNKISESNAKEIIDVINEKEPESEKQPEVKQEAEPEKKEEVTDTDKENVTPSLSIGDETATGFYITGAHNSVIKEKLKEAGLPGGTGRGKGVFLSKANKEKAIKALGIKSDIKDEIKKAEAETNTNPSEAQIEADNYKKGRVTIDGLNIAIENPVGSTRSGTGPDGKKWSVTMKTSYGDIKGYKGADGDDMDVFIGDKPESKMVYVIDQDHQHNGGFDEHKVMIGFTTIASAKKAYLENYESGWTGLGALTPVKMDKFKEWLKNGDLTKPFASGGPEGGKPLSNKGGRGEPTELSKASISEGIAARKEKHGKYSARKLNVSDINKAIDNASDGTDNYKDFISAGTYAANNIEVIKDEFSSMTKPQIFKLLGRGFEARYKNEKKEFVSRVAADTVLSQFRFFMADGNVIIGSTNKSTVLKELDNFNEDQFLAKQKERIAITEENKKLRQQREEGLKNPKTLDDYRALIRMNGFESLTDDQVRIVDELFTEGQLVELAKDREQAATVQAVTGDIEFELAETVHTKSGEPRYVVNLLGDRMDKDAYTEVSNKARQFGGRYVNPVMAKRWDTIPGFQFSNEEDRNSFANILSGESVSKAERQERAIESKKDKRVTKLREMAESLNESADASLNQDRKDNTAKRAAEAASAINAAYEAKDFAKTMNAIADSTEKGEVRLISNLGTKIQLAELESINRRTIYNLPKDKVDELTSMDNMGRRNWKPEVTFDQKVRYADYPIPSGNVARLKYLAGQMEDAQGFKQAAKGIQSRIKNLNDRDKVVMNGRDWESIVDKIKDFARQDKYNAGEWVKEAFLTADRLNKMGINGKPTLRYALRELNSIQSGIKKSKPKADPIKESEKAIKDTLFANRNPWNDFFPTPEREVNDVVEIADIKPGMKVLEPSAGMGHIADKLRDAGADVDVVEMASTLRGHLELKDHKLVGDDFLEYNPGPIYDRIVMNPPFSNDQDIKHINHAYTMLKPGGKIVAVTSSMAGNKGNSVNKEFRLFLEDVEANETAIAEGAFKESFNPTAVNTKIIEIDKPEGDVNSEEVDFDNIQFSRHELRGRYENGLTQQRVSDITESFISGYSGLADVNVMVVPTQSELERLLDEGPIDGAVSGTWDSGSNTVYIVAENHYSPAEVKRTLRHELITHYGLMETLNDTEYDALTERVLSTRNNPLLKDIWAEVDKIEHDAPDSLKAEEVIARMSEVEGGKLEKIANKIISWVMGALRRSGLLSSDKITVSEIKELINSIDRRLRDDNLQKRRDNAVRFSRKPEKEVEAIQPTMSLDDALETQQSSLFSAVKRGLSKAPGIDALQKNKYAALTLRQISEIGAKKLPSLTGYVNSVNEMMVTQNVLAEDVADLTSEVSDWAKKNKEKAEQLFSMMHDATLGGVDPSKKFEPMTEILEAEAARIERRLRSTGGEVNKDLTNRLNEVRDAIKNEPNRQREHARLREKYSKIPADSKAYFKKMKNHYEEQRGRMREALEKSIERAQVEESVKKEMLRTIRFDNERAEKEIYFPLARFGDYWIDVADENGERRFMMYETNAEMQAEVEKLQKAGYKPKFGQKLEQSEAIGGASIGFVSDVIQGIKKMKLNDQNKQALIDDVYQLYLASMPDRSLRRSFIHRKGVAGFSQDAIRAMADQGFKQSRQQARLDHMDDLNGYMEEMKKRSDEVSDVATHRIYNEMTKRHEWVQNPQRSAWAQKLTGLGFVWLLGLTPAAALVNLTQNVQVALPVLGSKYGMAKASAQMAKATADFFRAAPIYFKKPGKFGILGAGLEGREKEAIREAIKTGAIDTTQAADLIGLAENPSAQYTGFWNKSMNIIGWAFQKAEVFNREVTFITAYRLAYADSKNHQKSVDYAIKATWDSHFDYGSLNRARFMQSDIAAVALQFKQYSQNMSYYLYMNLVKSFKPGTPKEERNTARKQLLWTMAMTFGIGGMNSLPLAVVTGPMALAQIMFGEEDDPFDPDIELKKMLSDYFGEDVAKAMWFGASPSVSGRISLDSLWWRENDRDMPADEAYLNALQQALGPVVGGIGMSMARGIKDFSNEHYARGAESMLPKAARDILKTVRYTSEGGVYNRAGDAIIEDMTFAENLGQVAGFIPSRLVVQYDQNSALKTYEMQAKARRSQLMNAYYMAYRTKDTEAMANIRVKVKEWNKSEWGKNSPITNTNIRQSIRRRLMNLKEMDDGVKIDKRYKRLTEEYKYFG
ncbi:hypothetical protein VPAG_00062 [Vibrio phage douglas 12A4]|uniref:hypothetical protein n=1 Tax=Vibrio phage douglas 12A4 TaxID=573171 RepID=UPI0002C09483|nr:hypothetical protein VPAG_00062 [Vibrio phage douglas 12A4]AGG58098.1 hypothetical protein VPAG_00062 [Vibrio phage douglas 12A4]